MKASKLQKAVAKFAFPSSQVLSSVQPLRVREKDKPAYFCLNWPNLTSRPTSLSASVKYGWIPIYCRHLLSLSLSFSLSLSSLSLRLFQLIAAPISLQRASLLRNQFRKSQFPFQRYRNSRDALARNCRLAQDRFGPAPALLLCPAPPDREAIATRGVASKAWKGKEAPGTVSSVLTTWKPLEAICWVPSSFLSLSPRALEEVAGVCVSGFDLLAQSRISSHRGEIGEEARDEEKKEKKKKKKRKREKEEREEDKDEECHEKSAKRRKSEARETASDGTEGEETREQRREKKKKKKESKDSEECVDVAERFS